MRLTFATPDLKRPGAFVVFATDGGKLSASADKLDKASGGALKRALKNSKFKGRKGQTLVVLGPTGLKASRILLLGIGKVDKVDDLAAQSLGGAIFRSLGSSGDKTASVIVDTIKGVKLTGAEFAANVAYGCQLRSYRFDKYRTQEKPEDKPSLTSVAVMVKEVAGARRKFAPLGNIADGVFFTRDLVSEPANILYPISFAARLRALTKLGVKLKVLDEKQMKKLGMGALLGVGQGSANPSRIVAMEWNGAPKAKDKQPIAFVGKGVTFDTGGISIKPAGGMEDMKWDMAGCRVGADACPRCSKGEGKRRWRCWIG